MRGALSASALVVGLALRRAKRRRDEELHLVLLSIKHLCKSTYYMVSDAKGERFSERGLASFARKHGIAPGATLDTARAVLRLLETRRSSVDGVVGPINRRLRHALVRGGVDGALLSAKFSAMRDAYVQQPLDYGPHSAYGDKWRISCYLVVLDKWKPRIDAHPPMVACMTDVMRSCVDLFEQWASARQGATVTVRVMNCFVTRYRPRTHENQLKRHIDGANVDGSVILALPTDEPFQGGALKVWEAKREFLYPDLRAGDAILLDARVWHQALPISQGTRYAMVLFLKNTTRERT